MREPLTVVVMQKHLPHYRVAFFEALRSKLEDESIRLRLVYGDPSSSDSHRHDTAHLSWAEYRRNTFLRIGRRYLIWQPVLDVARRADLVIVEQANKLLINNVLLAWQFVGGPPVVFWGHGANLQRSDADALEERLKRRVALLPAWWFAYTQGCKDRVAGYGYPRDRITVLQNSIDTTALSDACSSLTRAEIDLFRSRHELGQGPI